MNRPCFAPQVGRFARERLAAGRAHPAASPPERSNAPRLIAISAWTPHHCEGEDDRRLYGAPCSPQSVNRVACTDRSGYPRASPRGHAPVAQLDRASDYESEGRTFESFRARQVSSNRNKTLTTLTRAPLASPSKLEHAGAQRQRTHSLCSVRHRGHKLDVDAPNVDGDVQCVLKRLATVDPPACIRLISHSEHSGARQPLASD